MFDWSFSPGDKTVPEPWSAQPPSHNTPISAVDGLSLVGTVLSNVGGMHCLSRVWTQIMNWMPFLLFSWLLALQFPTAGIKTMCEHTWSYVGNYKNVKITHFMFTFFKIATFHDKEYLKFLTCFYSLLSDIYILLRYWMSAVSTCSVNFLCVCVRRCVQTFDWLSTSYYDYTQHWILPSKLISCSFSLCIVHKRLSRPSCCSVDGNVDHLHVFVYCT